jgi:SAM-dependent methyltransferase
MGIDPDRLGAYALRVFGTLDGAVTAAMIHLGGELGLYRGLANGPASSHELAERTQLHERWVREWLHNQVAAGLLEVDGERFVLPEEARAVLVDESHPAFGMGWFSSLPETMAVLRKLPTSFRTGVGLPYDEFGEHGAVGIERSFAPWYRNFLVPLTLPALEGVVDKLERGAAVADVGCGAGVAVLTMAAAFPKSTFTGYDISIHALARARQKAAALKRKNAHFVDADVTPLPRDHSLDLVTTFDCIHDMTRPASVIASIRESLADDGTWLLVDIKAKPTLAENVADNPMAAMMYGVSVLTCMSSAMSEPGGEGLGTLGLPEKKARLLAEQAGFTRFRRLDIDHPVNAFYEIRP